MQWKNCRILRNLVRLNPSSLEKQKKTHFFTIPEYHAYTSHQIFYAYTPLFPLLSLLVHLGEKNMFIMYTSHLVSLYIFKLLIMG